jgi:hypothetical protein
MAVTCLLSLPPAYAAAMLERWGRWRYLSSDHASVLVSLTVVPECRNVALQVLSEMGPHGMQESDYLVLSNLPFAALTLNEKIWLVSLLMSGGGLYALERFAEVLGQLPVPEWGRVGGMLSWVENEGTIRAAIVGLAAFPWSTRYRHWRWLGPMNASVTNVAKGAFLEDSSSSVGRVAFALAQTDRVFLENVFSYSESYADRLIALEALVSRHLELPDALMLGMHAISDETATAALSKEVAAQLLDVAAAFVNKISESSSDTEREAVLVFIETARGVLSGDAQLRTLEALVASVHLR